MCRTLLLGLAFGMLPGCYNYDTDYFPTEKPALEDVVGSYNLDAPSIKLASEAGYERSDGSIVLRQDGSFAMETIPDWWKNFGKSNDGYDSGTGAWKLVNKQEWWVVELIFTSRSDFSSHKDSGGFSTQVTLFGLRAPYKIWLKVGDADAGRIMVFDRE